MSDRTLARRTAVKLYFKGKDISKDLSKYLLSLSFTDKEEDETDDISISLDDREGKWIKDWLNTNKTAKSETVTTKGEVKVGNIVQFKGGPVYISSMAAEPTVTRGASKCKCTIANSNAHPYHLISQDGKGVYGWVNAESVKEVSTTAQNDPKTVSKGDTVTFTGGPVYISSTAAKAAKEKNVTSTCKVTAINTKGTHPYHCISQDGKGVYGWVDKADVK